MIITPQNLRSIIRKAIYEENQSHPAYQAAVAARNERHSQRGEKWVGKTDPLEGDLEPPLMGPNFWEKIVRPACYDVDIPHEFYDKDAHKILRFLVELTDDKTTRQIIMKNFLGIDDLAWESFELVVKAKGKDWMKKFVPYVGQAETALDGFNTISDLLTEDLLDDDILCDLITTMSNRYWNEDELPMSLDLWKNEFPSWLILITEFCMGALGKTALGTVTTLIKCGWLQSSDGSQYRKEILNTRQSLKDSKEIARAFIKVDHDKLKLRSDDTATPHELSPPPKRSAPVDIQPGFSIENPGQKAPALEPLGHGGPTRIGGMGMNESIKISCNQLRRIIKEEILKE